jgi:hypothetical protein
MIKKKTALVLGAGASMPYGYPSGSTLRAALMEEATFQGLISNSILPSNAVSKFCKQFLRSGISSIDAFLSRRGKEDIISLLSIEDVGKLGVAAILRRDKSIPESVTSPQINPNFPIEIKHLAIIC